MRESQEHINICVVKLRISQTRLEFLDVSRGSFWPSFLTFFNDLWTRCLIMPHRCPISCLGSAGMATSFRPFRTFFLRIMPTFLQHGAAKSTFARLSTHTPQVLTANPIPHLPHLPPLLAPGPMPVLGGLGSQRAANRA